MLLDSDETIYTTLKPSPVFLEKKYKKSRRNGAIDLFKWGSIFLILIFSPILIFPTFFTEILPQFIADPSGPLIPHSEFWAGIAMIVVILYFAICIVGAFFFILYIAGAALNLMPVKYLISRNEDRELVITNKKLIEITKKKEYDFHFYEDMHEKGSCRDVYSTIIEDDFGNHLAIAGFQFNNIDPKENLMEVQAYIRAELKKLYPIATFTEKSWYQQHQQEEE